MMTLIFGGGPGPMQSLAAFRNGYWHRDAITGYLRVEVIG